MERTIGLGITTFNRPDYAKQCLESLIKNKFGGANRIYLYNDGSDKEHNDDYMKVHYHAEQYGVEVYDSSLNQGVGQAKNFLLERMMNDGCTHCFLIEDDILLKDPDTCNKYINYAKEKGIHHMNFALHGPLNKDRKGEHNGICVYPHCVGAFSYYTTASLEIVGLMDENFNNAWEHVELTYRYDKKFLTTPFWFFADHPESGDMLTEIEGSIDYSSIRPREDWQKNIKEGQEYWIKKHGEWLPKRPTI